MMTRWHTCKFLQTKDGNFQSPVSSNYEKMKRRTREQAAFAPIRLRPQKKKTINKIRRTYEMWGGLGFNASSVEPRSRGFRLFSERIVAVNANENGEEPMSASTVEYYVGA
ncbi:unnamed protein product [Microthlaspi erraticum]|uniref:Uncharacterized protein n=1 Tax=Microthlaspi erraticum TaxID=1685480 RepID=A0A6D2HN76_9BRAS|nr:unnamed protein product [Microthlaspi erraticum]